MNRIKQFISNTLGNNLKAIESKRSANIVVYGKLTAFKTKFIDRSSKSAGRKNPAL
jgi:hypothetical protein